MALDFADTFNMDPVYDIGSYQEPSWVTDDFFQYSPDKTSGIDWTKYYEPSSDGDFGSDLLKNSLKFVSDYAKGSDGNRESQYYAQQKAKDLGLADDRYPHVVKLSDSVSQLYGGGYGPMLAGAQGAQSMARMGMPSMGIKDVVGAGMRMAGDQLVNKALYAINPVLGAVNQFYPGGAPAAFKDVTRFAGGIGNTVASGVGGVVKGGIDLVRGIFDWCDERVKVDIAPLERTEVNNELAQMAFFVKGLRERS